MSGISNGPILVAGWSVTLDGDEPRIRDEELGKRLGFSRARDIRRLIDSLMKDRKLNDIRMRAAASRIELRRGVYRDHVVNEYWLTERQALKVIAKSETAIADAILDEVIDVFIAVRRGQLAASQQVPVLSTSPVVGDSRLHRAEMSSWCKMAARNSRVSVQRVHGELRRELHVPGVYHLPLLLYPQARKLLEALAFGRLLLPPRARRRHLVSVPADPSQRVLPFPGTP